MIIQFTRLSTLALMDLKLLSEKQLRQYEFRIETTLRKIARHDYSQGRSLDSILDDSLVKRLDIRLEEVQKERIKKEKERLTPFVFEKSEGIYFQNDNNGNYLFTPNINAACLFPSDTKIDGIAPSRKEMLKTFPSGKFVKIPSDHRFIKFWEEENV